MFFQAILLISGIMFLWLGSEWLVRGSVHTAAAFRIRPAVIGLTIVATATSAPEFLVSVLAATKGASGISVGNILGSNVLNIALVLGLSALVRPLSINSRMIKTEIPYMIIISLLLYLIVRRSGRLNRVHAVVFLLLFFLYIGIAYRLSIGI